MSTELYPQFSIVAGAPARGKTPAVEAVPLPKYLPSYHDPKDPKNFPLVRRSTKGISLSPGNYVYQATFNGLLIMQHEAPFRIVYQKTDAELKDLQDAA